MPSCRNIFKCSSEVVQASRKERQDLLRVVAQSSGTVDKKAGALDLVLCGFEFGAKLQRAATNGS